MVSQSIEISTVHHRLLKHLACNRELIFRQAEIGEEFIGKAIGELKVEALDKRNTFIALNIPGTDFLRSIVARTPQAKLNAGGVVMQVINAIIDAVVL